MIFKRITLLLLLSFCVISPIIAQKAISYSHPGHKGNAVTEKKEVKVVTPKQKRKDTNKCHLLTSRQTYRPHMPVVPSIGQRRPRIRTVARSLFLTTSGPGIDISRR